MRYGISANDQKCDSGIPSSQRHQSVIKMNLLCATIKLKNCVKLRSVWITRFQH